MKLIMLGAPGCGKGTQAAKLSKQLNVPTISTGVIIRNAITQGTEIGKLAKSYIDNGELVPDDVVVAILKERIKMPDCNNGFILDGFPRTLYQAEVLEQLGVQIDAVINIVVDEEEILRRLTGRLQCPHCGSTYHVTDNPPKTEGVCDICKEILTAREDDKPEIIRQRLDVYNKQTKPLEEFYRNKGILKTIFGKNDVRETTRSVFAAIGVDYDHD
jgi:adenylate kinase